MQYSTSALPNAIVPHLPLLHMLNLTVTCLRCMNVPPRQNFWKSNSKLVANIIILVLKCLQFIGGIYPTSKLSSLACEGEGVPSGGIDVGEGVLVCIGDGLREGRGAFLGNFLV